MTYYASSPTANTYYDDNGFSFGYFGGTPITVPIAALSSAMWTAVDAPSTEGTQTVAFPNGYEFERSDAFKTYFIYKPAIDDSIWVPLGELEWAWSGISEYSVAKDAWTLRSSERPFE